MSQFLNLPDLILIAFLLCSISFGGAQGLVRTVIGLFGKLAVIIGSVFLAKTCAPVLAFAIVNPILGDLFAYDLSEYLINLPAGTEITQSALKMSEGVAFLILFFVFAIVLAIVLHGVQVACNLALKFPPLGFIDRLGGAALGLVGGLVLALLLLHIMYMVQPELFAPLGWLEPERIANTVLVSKLLAVYPI